MKALAQAFLIITGTVGFLVSMPAAFYGWLLHRGFGGDLTSKDRLVLFGPLLCLAAILVGVVWRNRTSPKRAPRKLTEGGGAFSDVGGFDS